MNLHKNQYAFGALINDIHEKSNLSDQQFKDFVVFDELAQNDALQKEYQRMQKNYVFAKRDQLAYEYMVHQWKKLEPVLRQLDESS